MVIRNFAVTNAPPSPAAVNDDYQNFIVGHARFESVNEFATCHFRQTLCDLRHDAAGDVDDFVFLRVGNECQGTAETAAARLDDDRFVICHVTHLLSRLERLAQRNALLFPDVSRAEIRYPTAQEVNHDIDQQVAQCKVDVIKSESPSLKIFVSTLRKTLR